MNAYGCGARAARFLPPWMGLCLALSVLPAADGFATHRLAPIRLGDFYEPETISVQPVSAPSTLPRPFDQLANGREISVRLNLDANARTAIERHGLVAVRWEFLTNVIEVYGLLRQAGIPAFITSDTVLHLYHVQFDDILKSVEANEFYPKLATLSQALFDLVLAPLTNGIPDGLDASTLLVADVHTDANTSHVLEEALGPAHLLLAAYPLPDGTLALGAGPVFAYYEFKWPMNDRLTDEAWAARVAAGQEPPPPPWTRAFLHPVALPPADTDGDGLADEWEEQHWGGIDRVNDADGDPDGDGLSNRREALAGTDPTRAASVLRFIPGPSQPSGLTLQWCSVPDRRYRLFFSDNFRDWYLWKQPITAQGETTSLEQPLRDRCRFYRVQSLPPAL